MQDHMEATVFFQFILTLFLILRLIVAIGALTQGTDTTAEFESPPEYSQRYIKLCQVDDTERLACNFKMIKR